MRPRFSFRVPLPAAEVVERLERRLGGSDCPCTGMVAGNHRVVEFRVLDRDRHLWSPALGITVTDDETQGGSVVHGVVGPNPNVWTLFATAYIGLLTLLMFVAIFGFAQWTLDQRPWGLYAVPVLVVTVALVYLLARAGQRLAAPQTVVLRRFLEDALDVPEAERAVTDRDPYHAVPTEG